MSSIIAEKRIMEKENLKYNTFLLEPPVILPSNHSALFHSWISPEAKQKKKNKHWLENGKGDPFKLLSQNLLHLPLNLNS